MKETYWGYWLIVLGILIIGVMLLVNNTSTSSTNDYYTIKEVTQASMIDALDFAYYRLYGDVKMSEQKFVENFVRRFADNTALANTYEVSFYDLYEVPPKVSVKIASKSGSYNIAFDPTSFDVVSTIDAILEVGVPSTGNKPSKTLICPLFVNALMGTNLKKAVAEGNTDATFAKYFGAGNNAKAAKELYELWVAADANLSEDGLREAFNKKYSDMESLKGDELYKKYPELKDWKNREQPYIAI